MRVLRGMVAGCVLLIAVPSQADQISGTARVIDGDTIDLAGQRIRLWGIDAPERDQVCSRFIAGSPREDIYECGHDAAAFLAELTRNRAVTCDPRDRDRFGRMVAVCHTAAGELNREMVRRGWAIDYSRYSRGAYLLDMARAAGGRLGMWSGRFQKPEEFRHRQK